MNTLMLLPLFVVLLGLCLQFVLAGIIHFSSKDMGLKKDYTLQPTVTVLVACYNEGEAIYRTIESVSKSVYPNFEIRVLDDCSKDDSFEWMQKAAQDFPNVIVTRNEVNLGKGRTILKGLAQSSAEIVVTIDSDTIVAPDALQELTACFGDPKIALVGGSIGISNPNENALTSFQVCVYYLLFRLAKIPEAYWHCVTCVSGCLSAIRRTVFLELVPDIEARNFFGSPVRYGEDRFITHQTLLHGYDTYCNLRAKCWTPAPNTVKSYWAQQLRWTRSGMGDFLRTVRYLPTNIKHLKPIALYNRFVMSMALVSVIAVPFTDNLAYSSTITAAGFLVIVCILTCAVNAFHPEQKITNNPLRIVALCAWGFIKNILMLPLAVLTLDSDGWGGQRNQKKEGSK